MRDQFVAQRDLVPDQSLLVAGQTLDAGRRIHRAGDEGDVGVAHLHQFIHHGRGGSLLIGVDAMAVVAPQLAV
ncbi:hypothetical protein D3C72_1956240 [compost metagenome]